MARYAVTGSVTIPVLIEVEANSEDEARSKADDAPMQQLCHHCAEGDPEAWSTSGELDGTPTIEAVSLATPKPKRKGARR